MMRNKVEICGVDTSKLPVLKNEEMRELFKKMHEGDPSSKGKTSERQPPTCIECDPAL